MPGPEGMAADDTQHMLDLGSYLEGDGGSMLFDGWDLPGTEAKAHHTMNFAGDKLPPTDELLHFGDARDSLLPDDILDFFGVTADASFFAGHGAEPTTATTSNDGPCRDKCEPTEPTASEERHRSENPSGSSPKVRIKGEGEQSKSISIGRKRPLEEASVMEMARKLVEARKGEQSAALAKETKALSTDNHRLIGYLKQLGAKLSKARVENKILKQMVSESGGEGRAEIAQLQAAAEGEAPARRPISRPMTASVADKVSALSVQHLRKEENGQPVPCLRSTAVVLAPQPQEIPHNQPASQPASQGPGSRALEDLATPPSSLMGPGAQIAAAASRALKANSGNPTGALVDLLRLVEAQMRKKQTKPM